MPPVSQSVSTRCYANRIPGFSLPDIVRNEFWMDHVVDLSVSDAGGAFSQSSSWITAERMNPIARPLPHVTAGVAE